MASLNLSKSSYEFSKEKVDEIIDKKKVGNYALGFIKDKTFIVKYVAIL